MFDSPTKEELVQEYCSEEELLIEVYLRDLDDHVLIHGRIPSPPTQDNIGPIELKNIIDPSTKNYNPPLIDPHIPILLYTRSFDNYSHITNPNPIYQ
jgi:hypothetical protein